MKTADGAVRRMARPQADSDPYRPIILDQVSRGPKLRIVVPRSSRLLAWGLSLSLGLAAALAYPVTRLATAGVPPPAPVVEQRVQSMAPRYAILGLGDGREVVVPADEATRAASGYKILTWSGHSYPHSTNVTGDYVADGVNYSMLINDADFEDWNALSQKDIQQYLVDTDSFLATYTENKRPASAIIALAARKHSINPKVILATLEKETSLVTRTQEPPRRVMVACMGYGFPDSRRHRIRHVSGFSFQVDRGTGLLRKMFNAAAQERFPATQTVDYGQRRIQVRNRATLALYRYTPHTCDTRLAQTGGGNYGFKKWMARIEEDTGPG